MTDIAPKKSIFSAILAIILWLLSFGLGLEDIYASKELGILFMMSRGNTLADATNYSLWIVYILGLACLVFIIASTEYHVKHYGTPKSWRLLAWTLAIQILIYIIYIIL